MIKMRMRADLRPLEAKERRVGRNADRMAKQAAERVKEVIRENWTRPGPSTEGEPPGVVTGNLDTSIFVEGQGRDVLGRFAGKDAKIYHVSVDTTKGSTPQINGRERGHYAAALDDTEGRFNRPFVDRAVDQVGEEISFIFRKVYD